MRRAHLALAIVLLVAPLAGCAGSNPAPAEEQSSHAWSFEDTEGVEHSNETAAGSPTVLFFMATWCSSCEKKTEDMRGVHDAYEEGAVDVFSVTVDDRENAEDLEAWKAEHEQPWPHGVDEGLEVARTFGVDQTSNVVILDGENRVVEHWGYGQATESEMREVLDELLA